jgi:hypothetical protein
VFARVVIGAHLHEEVGAGDDLINKKTNRLHILNNFKQKNIKIVDRKDE